MTATCTQIINDVLLEDDERPQSKQLDLRAPTEGYILEYGRLRKTGWLTNVVVSTNQESVAFSVQVEGGRIGFSTDILLRFVDEAVIREYAEYALAQILHRNGWKEI